MGGWSAEDFEQLRAEQGNEVRYLDLLPGKPPIGVDTRGLADLAAAGKISNPVAVKVFAAYGKGSDTDKAGDEDPTVQARVFEQLRAQAEWEDMIFSAIIVDPPYCPEAEMPPDGKRPEGKLCYADFRHVPEVRRRLSMVPLEGIEPLLDFRPEPAGAAVAPDRGGVRPAAEQPAVPAPASLPAAVAGRRDLAPGGPGGDDSAVDGPPGFDVGTTSRGAGRWYGGNGAA